MANCAPASAIICGQPGRTLRPVIITTSIFVCGDLAGGGTVESTLLFHRCPPAEQVGQLRHVGGYAPCLVAGEQLGRRAAIDIGERLPISIADDEAPPIQLGVGLLDGPGRREAARFGHAF